MTARRNIRWRVRTTGGFSLIELMIAIVLGALVVAGLINVLIANRQAYHLQEANNYNQQNMRFAMDRIGWSLRMTQFWGGVSATNISGTPKVTGVGNCDATWILDVADGIQGYDGSNGFPAALKNCVNDANYVDGSDVLVLRYADTDAVDPAAALAPGKIYLQAQTGGRGILFADTRPADLPNSIAGVSTYPYVVEMYYLRPCSDLAGAATCSAASDDGHPIPTLMRLRLDDSGALINEPVVEGVEQLQFEYGLRTDPDNTAPLQYMDASAVTAAGRWGDVISVRIGYVVRAQTRDVGIPHTFDTNSIDPTNASFPMRLSADCQYIVSANGSVDVSNCPNFSKSTALDGQAQQFARTLMTSVAQLRNRIRQ